MISVRLDCDDMECGAGEDIDVVSRHWKAGTPISSYLPKGWNVIQADCDEAVALCPKHAAVSGTDRAEQMTDHVTVRLLNPNQCGNCQHWSWEHIGPVHPCKVCDCGKLTHPDPDRTSEDVPEPD